MNSRMREIFINRASWLEFNRRVLTCEGQDGPGWRAAEVCRHLREQSDEFFMVRGVVNDRTLVGGDEREQDGHDARSTAGRHYA